MWTEITRQRYERKDLRYASDLTDAEWRVIESHMPPAKALGRPRTTDSRPSHNAMQIRNQVFAGLMGQRQNIAPTALAGHSNLGVGPVDVIQGQTDDLAGPQS